jgi:hypothetical protein
MRKWIPNHPDMSVFAKVKDVCPVCLGDDNKPIGVYTAYKNQYPEFRCSCGAVWHSSKSIKTK